MLKPLQFKPLCSETPLSAVLGSLSSAAWSQHLWNRSTISTSLQWKTTEFYELRFLCRWNISGFLQIYSGNTALVGWTVFFVQRPIKSCRLLKIVNHFCICSRVRILFIDSVLHNRAVNQAMWVELMQGYQSGFY